MMAYTVHPYRLDALKTLVLFASGIKNLSPADCRTISFLIIKKTNLGISETTIKKLYGFALTMFNPSLFTLNALSIFCDFENWEAFCDAKPHSKEPQEGHRGPVTLVPPRPHTTKKPDQIFVDPLISVLLESAVSTLILKANAPDFTIVAYNEAYKDATYTKARDVKGLSLWDAFDPKLAVGLGPTSLLENFHEAIYKQRVIQMEPLHYNILSAIRNIPVLCWWDIKITPISYRGIVSYLVLHIHNITNKVVNHDAIERAIIKELTLAEDLATTNVNLNLYNEKLAESYEQLNQGKLHLEELNKTLESRVFDRTKMLFESEEIQRKLIFNAPVAIAVLKGPDHIVETANKKIIEYWGKTDSVIDKPLAVAIPELDGQPFIEILNKVRKSGVRYVNTELCAFLNYNGSFQPRYYDMIYQPVQYINGVTDSIFIVAVDITDHVNARQSLQRSESMLRLAVTSGNIGTWSLDVSNKVFTYNHIFARILGWDSKETISYEMAIANVTDEYRDRLTKVIEQSLANLEPYDVRYAQKRFNDGKIIYLRSTGSTTFDDSGNNKLFSGVIREITERDLHTGNS
jgi:PAS domain S-box-containing protein